MPLKYTNQFEYNKWDSVLFHAASNLQTEFKHNKYIIKVAKTTGTVLQVIQ